MLDKHDNQDFSKIKWGIFNLKYKRSAFERQIVEAVTIERESKTSEIVNSKAEWNQCSLPRLVTRIGNKEEEIREFEKEMMEEKKREDQIEAKIRNLRKTRNKARLITEKNNQPNKRQKIDETNYISIRDQWPHTTNNGP